jgi:hypothetical protein
VGFRSVEDHQICAWVIVSHRSHNGSGVRCSGGTKFAKEKSFEAQNFEVTWLVDITWDDVDTWDVCHVSVSFEPMED